jgi:diaminopimelate decarboxylase
MSATGTEAPAYVYDLDEVRRAHGLLRSALPAPSTLFYSVKANPHPAVIGALAASGCRAEVSSSGELAAALAAGVPAADVLYTGPGKRDAEVLDAARLGVRWFSVDSPAGVGQVARAADGSGVDTRCLVRVNAEVVPGGGQGLAMTGVTSAFGADAAWVAADPGAFRDRFAGFHLYAGSNLADADALVAQFGHAIATARSLADVLGVEPGVLDLGGGFPAPFARVGDLMPFPDLADRVAELLDAAFPGWTSGAPDVAFEAGRYLTATCGSLLVRVADVKHSHGRRVVVLESGINHLGGMSGLRRLPPLVPDVTAGDVSRAAEPALLAGPLCTPLDTWARAARLPEVARGEVLRVPNVGAYGLTASVVAFLSHPLPSEVVVENGRVADVSRLELVRFPLTR